MGFARMIESLLKFLDRERFFPLFLRGRPPSSIGDSQAWEHFLLLLSNLIPPRRGMKVAFPHFGRPSTREMDCPRWVRMATFTRGAGRALWLVWPVSFLCYLNILVWFSWGGKAKVFPDLDLCMTWDRKVEGRNRSNDLVDEDVGGRIPFS